MCVDGVKRGKVAMSYKQATIGLSVALGVTYLIFIILYVVFLREQLHRGEQVSVAISAAAENRALCASGAVACSFEVDKSTLPPVATSAAGPYSQAAARYGAQLVGLLQDAAIEQRLPEAMPGTQVVALLSGINGKSKSGRRNQRIGWILDVEPAALPAGSKKQLWIAFRGTQTREEWKVDFSFDQIPLDPESAPHVMVHDGFYSAYLEMAPTVRNYMKTLVTPDTTVYVTGHSLGAALAILCAVDLSALSSTLGISDLRLYAFAAPRVGNTAFVSMVSGYLGNSALKEMYVVANDADIVPSVPPAVTPNLSNPKQPLLYDHLPMLHFNENWGSWMLNHTLPVYIENLGRLTSKCDVATGLPPVPAATTGAVKARPHLTHVFMRRNRAAERRHGKQGKQQEDERSQLLRKLLFGF